MESSWTGRDQAGSTRNRCHTVSKRRDALQRANPCSVKLQRLQRPAAPHALGRAYEMAIELGVECDKVPASPPLLPASPRLGCHAIVTSRKTIESNYKYL
ncbi:TIR domain-containing adapter molecule 1 [Frankliniella fusca]|uniref:TIR domain-containing adapter molecule 1 n=1 Tax=Frankliniella fusca TaxID=407009 RepID=A0AAE1HGL2_9NEOP|nr:TIR domain-containing adapter molecule 1 [Frankliniella fusca]